MRSWFAATFPSTAACLLAMVLSRDFQLMLIPDARAALHRPGTAMNVTAAAPALTRAAVPLLHSNKPDADPWNGFGVFFKVVIYPHCFLIFPPWFWLGPSQAANGAHIHVVERLHGSPFEDITTIAPTLLYPFHGGYYFSFSHTKRRVEQARSPEKKKKKKVRKKARTKRLGDKVAFLWMQMLQRLL